MPSRLAGGFATALCALGMAGAAIVLSPTASAAHTFKVLYKFCSKLDCPEGRAPAGTLLMDSAGNLFGTTTEGGSDNEGVVYELSPQAGKSAYSEKVLLNFCAPQDCPIGRSPFAPLIMDTKGNLYGTAAAGGRNNLGLVYEIVRDRRKPRERVLHVFDGTHGSMPLRGALAYQGKESGALYDGNAPLYGVTNAGGATGDGTVFEIKPPAPGQRRWSFTDIHDFCQSDCSDGKYPGFGVIVDQEGRLFGSTGDGKIFEMSQKRHWNFTVLHTPSAGEHGGPLAFSAKGNLIGAAYTGGPFEHGEVFRLVPKGVHSVYTDLYDFCTRGGACSDGDQPFGILPDAAGNVFGVAEGGGANDVGVVFELRHGKAFHQLHTFCRRPNCADGSTPFGSPVMDANGNLYGITVYGGDATNPGVVYELTP